MWNEPQKEGKSLELWIFQYLHCLKSTQAVGEMCFPPLRKKKREKGGVAPISPHVGNLSHINLTPNFHTCSSTCWKSSNSLTHTHPHLPRIHTLLSGTWPWVSLGAGGEWEHHRRGSVKLAGMLGIFAPHVAWLCLSHTNPCSLSIPHLSSPWLNSSRPPAHTSEKNKSWMWIFHTCQKAQQTVAAYLFNAAFTLMKVG